MPVAGHDSVEFHLKEYECLKKEIDSAVQETRTLERYALVATAGVWTWLLATSGGARDLIWWIPSLLVFFAGLRSVALYRAVQRIGDYIRDQLEACICDATPCGWEHYINPPPVQNGTGSPQTTAAEEKPPASVPRPTARRSILFSTAMVFWVVLFLVTILVPVLVNCGLLEVPKVGAPR